MYDLAGHNNSITALVKDNIQNLLWSSSLDHSLMVYLLLVSFIIFFRYGIQKIMFILQKNGAQVLKIVQKLFIKEKNQHILYVLIKIIN